MGPRHLTVGPAEATRPQQAAPCRQLSRWMQAPTLSAQRLRQPVWGPSTVRWAAGPLGCLGPGEGAMAGDFPSPARTHQPVAGGRGTEAWRSP